MQRKLMEDPLVVIKKREMEERKRILDNPLKVGSPTSSLGRYVFGSEISYNKAPPRLPGLGC